MVYRGKVKDNVVILEPGARLPEGAIVRIELEPSGAPEAQPNSLLRMVDLAVDTGIPDLATNIDHYLYGHPKAGDAD
ncbi:MAG TPA: hypothetical protein VN493_03860 [Thermoanaerobaculia bacterium]|nr:hypothetical protein [Thermoanaerobaculia bacterium]